MAADQATSLDIQGEVFAQMMAHWHLEKPSVLAHDFGGATTLRAHLLHGVEFSQYVLMNVVAMRPWGSEFFDHVGRHTEAFLGLPPHIHEAIVKAYINGAIVNPVETDDLEALISPWLSEKGRVSFYRQFAQADEKYTAEIEPMFGDIRCKTSVLWGVDDPWIPIDRGQELAGRIGQSELFKLPGLGHLPQLEGPQKVLQALFEVL